MAPILFVGDLTYDLEKLTAGRVPGVGERRGLLESTRAVNELHQMYPDLVILAAHDPAAASQLGHGLEASLRHEAGRLVRYLVLAAHGGQPPAHAGPSGDQAHPSQSEVLRVLAITDRCP